MTKLQVAKKMNKIYNEGMDKVIKEINKCLKDNDMWYGEEPEFYYDDNGVPIEDRNGEQFFEDGAFQEYLMDDVGAYLHTRKELEKMGKEFVVKHKKISA